MQITRKQCESVSPAGVVGRLRPLAFVLVGLIGLAAAAGAVFVLGMRKKSPRVQRAVRRVNRAFWNPRAMETAGTAGASASVIHHVGRRSGAEYHTPIVPVKVDDGFVVALPYGTRADWVQNVLAAERATLTHEGRTYHVDEPTLMAIDRTGVEFDRAERTAQRFLKVDDCLHLRTVDPPSGESPDDLADDSVDRVHTSAM